MNYEIKFLRNVTEEDLPALSVKIESRIKKAIQERLTVDPLNLGEPLQHSFKGFRRLRVGDYVFRRRQKIRSNHNHTGA
ncbi:type II toxin-antitoxin system RelE family toxin [Wolbachia endosymbiont of Madathamugadia hiepei]|uniref:type II toxin-antitoxin system RelE family toxin n=1 Tax=Wolbachia endosymbiont of Madathamugadia hiepei TaxID=1241303 RepID=UPI001FE7B669|nr:hypothetical protein [Wolbachia endosymbiont of Madathamugadia hiepei]